MLNGFLSQLQNTVPFIQDQSGFNNLFMILGLILSNLLSGFLSDLLSGLLFRKNEKLKLKIFVTYAIVTATVFLISLGVVTLILQKLQQDSFWNLFLRIVRVTKEDYLLPFVISFFSGIFINWLVARKRERTIKIIFCIVLGVSAIVTSIIFFFNAFQLVQRPNYNVPNAVVASVVNSRLNVYPMVLSKKDLKNIEKRHKPKQLISNGDGNEDELDEGQEPDIPQPTIFAEYVSAAIDTINSNKHKHKVYLRRAYQLFLSGRHNDNYFNIGAMWHMLYYATWFQDSTDRKCLHNSIVAYKKCEQRGNISQALYINMALVYDLLDDVKNIRLHMRKALRLDGNEASIQSEYQSYVYDWIGDEELDLLMEDAGIIIDYSIKHKSKIPISMCVLYGACAADRRENVQKAYHYLVKVDKQYEEKDVMIKILRCICADMLGKNVTGILSGIYDLEEQAGGLSSVEELYLIRYLHAAGKYDQLWGYIAGVGATMSESDELEDLGDAEATDVADASGELEELKDADIEKAVIKAEWFFKNQSNEEYNAKDVEKLYKLISNRVQRGKLDKKDKKILQLSKLLLGNCLGIVEASDVKVVDAGEIEEVSDIAYVFLAVNAFNDEEYKNAIEYCEKFFKAEKKLKKKSTLPTRGFSLKDLEAQEQVILHYQMQLIYAHSHFEYARTKRGTEEWKIYLGKAYAICEEFEHSSKSFFYIGEQFDMLKGFIKSENGEISSNENDKVFIEQED